MVNGLHHQKMQKRSQTMFWRCFVNRSEKTNTNDGRTSKHSECDNANKMSNFPMELSDFRQHQKYARPETYVVTLVLYACETWKVTDNISSKMQVFVNKCLRIINSTFWPKTITNEELLNICSCRPITTGIKNRKWHTLRKEDTVGYGMEPPRMTWMRSKHAEYQDRYSWQEVGRMTQDCPR